MIPSTLTPDMIKAFAMVGRSVTLSDGATLTPDMIKAAGVVGRSVTLSNGVYGNIRIVEADTWHCVTSGRSAGEAIIETQCTQLDWFTEPIAVVAQYVGAGDYINHQIPLRKIEKVGVNLSKTPR